MKKLSKLFKAVGLVSALTLGFIGLATDGGSQDDTEKGGLCKAFGCGGDGGTGGDPEEH